MAKSHIRIPALSEQQNQRFWSYVDKTPGQGPRGNCWTWIGRRRPEGYGQVSIRQTTYTTSRIAYALYFKVDPADLDVCHHCDYPPCCNPLHFFLGTNGDNNRDRTRKGRTASGISNGRHTHPERTSRGVGHSRIMQIKAARGEQASRARFTARQVQDIRADYATGRYMQKELAAKHGCSRSAIQAVVERRTWKHI